MQLVFYLPTFSTPYMSHLLYLMFRYDFDMMKSLDFRRVFGSKHTPVAVAVGTLVVSRLGLFIQSIQLVPGQHGTAGRD